MVRREGQDQRRGRVAARCPGERTVRGDDRPLDAIGLMEDRCDAHHVPRVRIQQQVADRADGHAIGVRHLDAQESFATQERRPRAARRHVGATGRDGLWSAVDRCFRQGPGTIAFGRRVPKGTRTRREEHEACCADPMVVVHAFARGVLAPIAPRPGYLSMPTYGGPSRSTSESWTHSPCGAGSSRSAALRFRGPVPRPPTEDSDESGRTDDRP